MQLYTLGCLIAILMFRALTADFSLFSLSLGTKLFLLLFLHTLYNSFYFFFFFQQQLNIIFLLFFIFFILYFSLSLSLFFFFFLMIFLTNQPTTILSNSFSLSFCFFTEPMAIKSLLQVAFYDFFFTFSLNLRKRIAYKESNLNAPSIIFSNL